MSILKSTKSPLHTVLLTSEAAGVQACGTQTEWPLDIRTENMM